MTIAFLRIGDELAHFIIESDPVCLANGRIIEEDFAFSVCGRTLSELIAFRDKLPSFTRDQNIVKRVVASGSWADSLGPVSPKPSHCIRQDSRCLLARMPAIAPSVLHFITRKRQRAFHGLVGHPPVATVFVKVVGAILHKYTN